MRGTVAGVRPTKRQLLAPKALADSAPSQPRYDVPTCPPVRAAMNRSCAVLRGWKWRSGGGYTIISSSRQ